MKEKENNSSDEKDNIIVMDTSRREEQTSVAKTTATENPVLYVIKGEKKKGEVSLQDKRKEIFLRIVK